MHFSHYSRWFPFFFSSGEQIQSFGTTDHALVFDVRRIGSSALGRCLICYIKLASKLQITRDVTKYVSITDNEGFYLIIRQSGFFMKHHLIEMS